MPMIVPIHNEIHRHSTRVASLSQNPIDIPIQMARPIRIHQLVIELTEPKGLSTIVIVKKCINHSFQ